MVRNRNWANLEHSYLFILTPESSNIVDLDSKTEVVAAYLSPVNSRHEDRVAAQGTCPQATSNDNVAHAGSRIISAHVEHWWLFFGESMRR
ncbi:hypothetical protein SeLEV6574_g02805 [Synchytrium endobioticum]|uniref:Uncharacterized protein n=1 Tax=Synchytrium endobioticum TaxID=286115 RepID=A0A507D7E4_9FUNG|nr:hypothetical protein SeLEV6574_g02805 [Synchytrium endobioticum]